MMPFLSSNMPILIKIVFCSNESFPGESTFFVYKSLDLNIIADKSHTLPFLNNDKQVQSY